MTFNASQQIKTVVRITRRPQFLYVRDGISFRTRGVFVQARSRPNRGATHHIGSGFTATKKIGNAVVRNRSKRRLKAAAAELLPQYGLPGSDYVFGARRDTASLAWQRLLDDMESALISLAAKLKQDKNQVTE